MTVLFDTCVVIDLLRADPRALSFATTLAEAPTVSAITLLELYRGVRSRREEAAVERVLATLTIVLPDNQQVWRRAGEFMKHYQPSHGLDDLDALIAATAEHHGLKLATLNVKHFPMIKGLKRAY